MLARDPETEKPPRPEFGPARPRLSVAAEVEEAGRLRRWPRGRRSRAFGRDPEVREDSSDHRRVLDGREQAQTPAALGAGKDVDLERSAQKLGPRRVRPRL
jgi:hypothetical protein